MTVEEMLRELRKVEAFLLRSTMASEEKLFRVGLVVRSLIEAAEAPHDSR